MSYNYSQYVSALQSLLVASDPQGQTFLNAMLPNIIDYAEQRIYRELDLISTFTSTASTTTSTSRSVTIPSNIIVLDSANFITPANTTPDAAGATRNPMRRVTEEYMNFAWPNGSSTSGSPSIAANYAVRNNTTMLLAPAPDGQYYIECIGTYRPTPLSSTNTTTFLTLNLPDLFLAASMIFSAGYQRDFGAAGQVDDANLGVTWEKQYQTLKESANLEEMRKKANSNDWEPFSPAPLADKPR